MDKEIRRTEVEEMLYISEKLEIPFISLSKYEIPSSMIQVFSEKVCRSYQAAPLSKIGPVLTIALTDPLNVLILDELRSLTGLEIHPVVASPTDIINTINAYYHMPSPGDRAETGGAGKTTLVDLESIIAEPLVTKEETDVHKLTNLVESAPVVNTVNDTLFSTLKQGASDIHIECFENTMRIRYRIDGMLREAVQPSKEIQEGFIARIKIMSKLDITQRRLPQDGRFTVDFENRDVDFRVSVLPTNFGEKIVLRILDKGSMKLDLESLGFSPHALEIYQKVVYLPFGMILITGPTGSGKTTTLYSMINRVNSFEKNIVTIEDPIEYNLSGITQVQIKPEIGLSFANCLRAILRQSPDIIMLGEIRDTETADIAMKAALTGHLVLSTLHTNDAPSSIPRLIDMGIEPFLIAGAVSMVSAQRLCRRLCIHCREKYIMNTHELTKKMGLNITQEKLEFYRPVGCAKCNKTGYQGRVAVTEAFLIDDTARQMILNRAPSIEIKRYAQSQGMRSLGEDGFQKALAGETSLEEVIRVTAEF